MSLSNLIKYSAPQWATRLQHIPAYRVALGHLNTPIHQWHLPGLPANIQLYIKRDDMTGSTLSGNKVRKLEFLLADAIHQGCKHVITCGGVQSNHVRATMISATQLGLTGHAFLRTDDKSSVSCAGNLLLSRLCGANLYVVPRRSPYETHLKPRMESLVHTISEKHKEKAYSIPIGGSNLVGMFGYLEAFNELIKQNVLEDFDDIVFTCGSGGTAEGLAIANYLTGSKVRIHGICVSDDAAYFYSHIDATLAQIGLNEVKATDIISIIEGYKGRGYGLSSDHELDFITQTTRSTGIMLDPVYTGKGAYGLAQEINNTPQRFKGNRILFIHTGGIFGMYDGTLDTLAINTTQDRVFDWPEIEGSPAPIY